jgi:isopenicillin N synthase-like dioxygenase
MYHNFNDHTLELKHYPPIQLPAHLADTPSVIKSFVIITPLTLVSFVNSRTHGADASTMRFAEHTDLSTLTLLTQNNVGGLQVLNELNGHHPCHRFWRPI